MALDENSEFQCEWKIMAGGHSGKHTSYSLRSLEIELMDILNVKMNESEAIEGW